MNPYLKEDRDAAKGREKALREAEDALARAFRQASLAEIRESQFRVREAVVREALRRAR